ncbi:MAG TPA: hypothetical protein VFT26_05345 [Pyrinomonadaceae bacterium]|nr:hypothetical protein [Pyrinomonadaceae bacterium]
MTLRKGFFVVVFLALTVSAVNAYTVVMRDGRRVEIPNEFTVTNSTLTYDVGNGMQRTIQLNIVDISATERANGETQGAFLNRANAPAVEAVQQTRRAGAQRSVTNADLEKYRRARVEGEKEYETRRQELGLPSMEERRREVAAIEDRTLEQVRHMRAQEEAYWRSRAEALRAEMAASEGQSGASRQQQPEWFYSSFGGFPGFFDGGGFGFPDGRFGRFRRFQSSPFDGFLATPITPFPTFGGHGRRPVFRAPGIRINSRPFRGGHGSRR